MQNVIITEVYDTLVKLDEEATQFFLDADKFIKQKQRDSIAERKKEAIERGADKREIQRIENFVYNSGYWYLLSPELQEESDRITENIIESIKIITPAIKMSPLLTEADERDLSISVKTIRASLYLREFHFRDAEVIYDEDIVIGMQPAKQSDEREQDPDSAKYLFGVALDKVLSIIDLTTSSDTELQKRVLVNTPGVSGYKPNTAFIMMWMDNTKPELLDVSDTIKECFKKFGIKATRADEIEHEDLITRRILEEIKTSEFLCADLTGERPSVYYEIGYAHAIGKRVILYRKKDTRIHFDLAGYNCPEYENLRDIKTKLIKRLEEVTGRKPETT
jgi:hypothetical protein